jgi:enoyl-CoA hydratase/carnithine racemase
MNSYRRLSVEREGDTVTIWLNDPKRRNVLTLEMLSELIDAFGEVGDSDATGVILAAKGPVYCAGHDFTEMLDRDLEDVRHLFQTCTRMMDTMQSIPQPVIARVHALATGAGCQLVATADLAVASIDATFCTPGGGGGLFCTTPMVAVGRAIGRKHALEMAMSGDTIDATTAAAWGLVNRAVAPQDLDSTTSLLMRRVTRGSSASKAVGKQAFYHQIELDQAAAYEYAIEVMATQSQSLDAQEGISAFIEKRAPEWNSEKQRRIFDDADVI